MHKPGESAVSVDAGSASEWLHVLIMGAQLAAASVVLGAIIGFLFRGRVLLQVIASVIASVAFFALLEWRFGDPTEWSWHDPITSAAYLVGPAALFIGAPTLFAALLVGHLCMRGKSI
jgi:hypothetical protein